MTNSKFLDTCSGSAPLLLFFNPGKLPVHSFFFFFRFIGVTLVSKIIEFSSV